MWTIEPLACMRFWEALSLSLLEQIKHLERELERCVADMRHLSARNIELEATVRTVEGRASSAETLVAQLHALLATVSSHARAFAERAEGSRVQLRDVGAHLQGVLEDFPLVCSLLSVVI